MGIKNTNLTAQLLFSFSMRHSPPSLSRIKPLNSRSCFNQNVDRSRYTAYVNSVIVSCLPWPVFFFLFVFFLPGDDFDRKQSSIRFLDKPTATSLHAVLFFQCHQPWYCYRGWKTFSYSNRAIHLQVWASLSVLDTVFMKRRLECRCF